MKSTQRVVLLIFHRLRSVNLSMAATGEAGAPREAPWVYSSSDGLLKRKCAKRPLSSMCPSLQGLSSGKMGAVSTFRHTARRCNPSAWEKNKTPREEKNHVALSLKHHRATTKHLCAHTQHGNTSRHLYISVFRSPCAMRSMQKDNSSLSPPARSADGGLLKSAGIP